MKKRLVRGVSGGFTLIELLVVIAIIGILSAIVLASLNIARSRGNDAAIKSDMDTIRTLSSLYLSNNNSYGTNVANTANCADPATMFGTDPKIKSAIEETTRLSGTVYCRMTVNGGQWAIYAELKNPSAGNGGWCIDSIGAAKEIPAITVPIKNCP